MNFNVAARAARYSVETVSSVDADPANIRGIVEGLLRQRVDAIERVRGWRDELADRRLEVVAPIHGDWSAASGYRRGAELDVAPGSAVFVANDHMAIGVLSALRERGLRVPDDVSVVGFDDVPEAGYLYPALTTVRQDFAALGELMMQKVLVAVEEPDSATVDTPLPTHLVVRQSTRAVPS
jgi:DNA-binding LacI/PurR family transcriptional regulator